MNKVKSLIWVTFRKECLHRYPAALTDPRLSDVSYLGMTHRHILHFNVGIEVFHDDRDIEFIQFLHWLESLYSQSVLNVDFKSMEMISDDLAELIGHKYPGREVVITVSEDGENGATTTYQP